MQSDQVTVLVFKDNHPSRTFQLSLKWISQLGVILSAAAILLAATSFLAVKFYLASRHGSVSRAQSLEQELTQLKASHQALETQLTQHTQSVPPQPTAPQTAPTQTGPTSTHLFRALPADSAAPLPDRAQLPFNLTPPKVAWQGNSLHVRFGIQYSASDGGHQQGRIVILARSPDALMTYPQGVLNTAGNDVLIQPDRGEYFSVRSFRATEAVFGTVHSRDRIKEVEVLIFDTSNKLIFLEKLDVPPTISAPAAAPASSTTPPKAKPKTEAPTIPQEADHVPRL